MIFLTRILCFLSQNACYFNVNFNFLRMEKIAGNKFLTENQFIMKMTIKIKFKFFKCYNITYNLTAKQIIIRMNMYLNEYSNFC